MNGEATWLAIVLPRLKTDRLIRSGQAPEGRPLAVYAKEANAFLLTGVDARASALGLKLAMSLADARAIHPALATVEAEPDEDARALDNIAAWCERFTPVVVIDPPDGLFLGISGCAHLFGGEAALRNQIVTRLTAQGFAARAALGPTPGAAWALARYGQVQSKQRDIGLREALRQSLQGRGDLSELLAIQNDVRWINEPIGNTHRCKRHFDGEPLVQIASDDGRDCECPTGGVAIRPRQSARS